MRADRAEQLSAAIDQLLAGGVGAGVAGIDAAGSPAPGPELAEAGLLDTARQLARLPVLLGPVDPALERRIMHRVRTAGALPYRRTHWLDGRLTRCRLGWAVAGLVTVLLLALLVTPLGGAAVASFRAVFDLGRTDVAITEATTPTVIAGGVGVRQQMTLEEAQLLVAFDIPRPAYLPSGYALREVNGYSYPDLPAWVPQPFFVELVYGDSAGATCHLRAYPLALGAEAGISALNLEATSVQKVQDLDIAGHPGVLLRVGGGNWQELVWEHGMLILALSSDDLAEAELLQVARSVEL
jgi:hypothetical protein